MDSNFAPFLNNCTWEKKTKTNPNRGLGNDDESVPEKDRKTAAQKVQILELMLGQVANYCPIISRNAIIKASTSMESVWQTIRQHFGFQSTGAHFLAFDDIIPQPGEKPEDLYQRILTFIEDNMLLTGSPILHHGIATTEDEEMSPTLENLMVIHWLKLIHPGLPKLVKQRYGTELKARTLASMRPEISLALSSLMDELQSAEDAKVMRVAASKSFTSMQDTSTSFRARTNKRVCPLCLAAGRRSQDHYLSKCPFLPDSDKKFMAKARQVNALDLTSDEEEEGEPEVSTWQLKDSSLGSSHKVSRVQTRMSPYIDLFHRHSPLRLTVDSGATGNMLRHSTAIALGLTIKPSSQSAQQADGSSPLHVVGETKCKLSRDDHHFNFEALVVENLDVDALAGTPFMEMNDIGIRPAKREVILHDGSVYMYGSGSTHNSSHQVRRASVLKSTNSTTIWPGEFLKGIVPKCDDLAVEPRCDSHSTKHSSCTWPPPDILPIAIRCNDHVCQMRSVQGVSVLNTPTLPPSTPKAVTPSNPISTVQLDPPDSFGNEPIPISDRDIAASRHNQCEANHSASTWSKGSPDSYMDTSRFCIGDLVYLWRDRDKHGYCPRYIVTSIDGEWLNVGNSLRATSYRVRHTDCYTVPTDRFPNSKARIPSDNADVETEEPSPNAQPIQESSPSLLPVIPSVSVPEASMLTITQPSSSTPLPQVVVPDTAPNDGEDNPSVSIRRSKRTSHRPRYLRDSVT